jgi:hypothetical protein
MGRRGRLETAMFRWRGGSGGLWRPQGGSHGKRRRGEGGGAGVAGGTVRVEKKRAATGATPFSRGAREEIAEGGGPGGEAATRCREGMEPGPDRRAVPRSTMAQALRARAGGAVRTGVRRPLTRGPWLAVGGRGRGEAWGPAREKKKEVG